MTIERYLGNRHFRQRKPLRSKIRWGRVARLAAVVAAFGVITFYPTIINHSRKNLTKIVQHQAIYYQAVAGEDGRIYIMNTSRGAAYELEIKTVGKGEGYIKLIRRNLDDPAQPFTGEYSDLVDILRRYNCNALGECGTLHPKDEVYVPVKRLSQEETDKYFNK